MLQSNCEFPEIISCEVLVEEVSGTLSTWNKLAAPVCNLAKIKFVLLGTTIPVCIVPCPHCSYTSAASQH